MGGIILLQFAMKLLMEQLGKLMLEPVGTKQPVEHFWFVTKYVNGAPYPRVHSVMPIVMATSSAPGNIKKRVAFYTAVLLSNSVELAMETAVGDFIRENLISDGQRFLTMPTIEAERQEAGAIRLTFTWYYRDYVDPSNDQLRAVGLPDNPQMPARPEDIVPAQAPHLSDAELAAMNLVRTPHGDIVDKKAFDADPDSFTPQN
jgi:hypothetical protein